jgi:molybdate transport system substrate-binding protein
MPSFRSISLAFAPLALLLRGLADSGDAFAQSNKPAPAPLLVAAAVSLSDSLTALAPGFAAASKLPRPTFNFAASGLLQQQIQQGAPVDVFISAGKKQVDALEKAGLLLAGTRRELLGNQLVLAVPAQAPQRPLSFAGLAADSIRRIAIGDTTVPAGDYANQSFSYYKISKEVAPKLVKLGSVRAVANAVAAGDVDAGVVYSTDAKANPKLRIVSKAPEISHAPIRYIGAMVATSRQLQAGKAYLSFLTSPEAQRRFRQDGFIVLP